MADDDGGAAPIKGGAPRAPAHSRVEHVADVRCGARLLGGPTTVSESGAAGMRERLGAIATALFPDPASPPPAAIEEILPSVASSNDIV